jgi:hypothetical protein
LIDRNLLARLTAVGKGVIQRSRINVQMTNDRMFLHLHIGAFVIDSSFEFRHSSFTLT